MKILKSFSRMIVGLVFIFSGFVKAVDPLGSTYKFEDYFTAFGMEWMHPFALYLAIFMSAIEFILGIAFLFNVKMKLSAWGILLFMIVFTPLTFYLAIANPVSDCGCFGDALKLTNWQTFYKNIVIDVFLLIVFFNRKTMINKINGLIQNAVLLIFSLFILGISVYCYMHLPIIDFRPWKIGNKIAEQVVPTPEISEVFLVYKNIETGNKIEYTAQTLPWQDTILMAKLEFVEQRKAVTQEFKEAPIHDFIISDKYGEYTDKYVNNNNYQFLLIMHNVRKANKKSFNEINNFYKECLKDSISLIALSASDSANVSVFKGDVNTEIPFYEIDETALKTVIRSNPGLVLLKNGVVLDKWHYNDIPEYESFKKDYPEDK